MSPNGDIFHDEKYCIIFHFPDKTKSISKADINGCVIMADLNALYDEGYRCIKGEGVPKDLEKGIGCLRSAADQGHAGSQFSLGSCYYLGDIDVPRNFDKLIRLSAKQNNIK